MIDPQSQADLIPHGPQVRSNLATAFAARALAMFGKNPWAVYALLGSLLWAFYIQVQYREYGYTYDSAIYLAGAAGIAGGEGYRFVPFEQSPPIGTYPPGQSLLLAGAWWLMPRFPGNVPLLNQVAIITALAALLATVAVLRRMGLGILACASLAAAWGTGPLWCQWMFWLMSDFPFVAGTLAGVAWVHDRWKRDGKVPWSGIAVLLGILFWLRSAVLGLWLGACIVAWLSRHTSPARNWLRVAGVGAISLGALKLWMSSDVSYGAIYQRELELAGGLGGYANVVLGNIVYLIRGLFGWEMLFPVVLRVNAALALHFPAVSKVVGVLLGIVTWAVGFLALRGVLLSGRFARGVALVWLVYIAQVVVAPNSVWHIHRYLYPVAPLLVGAAWRGVPIQYRSHAVVLLGTGFALVLAANVFFTGPALRAEENRSALDDLRLTAEWVNRNLPSDARIAAGLGVPVVHFYSWTNHRLVVDDFADPSGVMSHVPRSMQDPEEADYLLENPSSSKGSFPREVFSEVFRSPSGAYRILRVDRVAAARIRSGESQGIP